MSEFIIDWDENLVIDTFSKNSLREGIVRCRDCKHGIKADLSGNWYECMKPDGNGDYARWDVEPDGFCAWGERKNQL